MIFKQYIFLFLLIISTGCTGCIAQERIPLILDQQTLEENLERLEAGESEVEGSVHGTLRSAEVALTRRPRSVTEKDRMPPSGDKQDFLDEATYWWPDPKQPDGLPYIRRDGESNPDRATTDAMYMTRMARDVHSLGLAWYYTNEEKYAEHAAELLRVWFLNEDTKMNPNLNYVALIPGRNENRGRGSGLIRTSVFVDMLDGVLLLTSSEAWTRKDHEALQRWFRQYVDWMRNSEVGRKGADQPNNIGTAYDMQLVCYGLFIGDNDLARTVLTESVPERMDEQFDEEGRQPYELRRSRSWSYSIANLNHWLRLVRLAEHVDIDLWSFETPSGRSIQQAVEYLRPYAYGEKEWEHEQIKNVNMRSSFRSLERRISSRDSQ